MSDKKIGIGSVITFYSYKGGVGRTFLLANIAWLMNKSKYKVLCLDWDLEAPGLSYYLNYPSNKSGLVELLIDFKKNLGVDWKDYVTKVDENLDVISAGCQDDGYTSKLRKIDWSDLYDNNFGEYLENIRSEWITNYDYVLIDSRTGISDIGGICTSQLPDILTCIFTANKQSLMGCIDVMQRAQKQRERLPIGRGQLQILPVPSRFELADEYQLANKWMDIFEQQLKPFYRTWCDVDVEARALLELLRVPYAPYWSYGERLSVQEERLQDPQKISYYIGNIAALLVSRLGDNHQLTQSRNKYLKKLSQGPLKPQQPGKKLIELNLTSAFLSYHGADLEMAKHLYYLLKEQCGVDVWLDQIDMGVGFLSSDIENAIKNTNLFISLAPSGLRSQKSTHWPRHEKSFATNLGKTVVHASLDSAAPFSTEDRHWDLRKWWLMNSPDDLIAQIRTEIENPNKKQDAGSEVQTANNSTKIPVFRDIINKKIYLERWINYVSQRKKLFEDADVVLRFLAAARVHDNWRMVVYAERFICFAPLKKKDDSFNRVWMALDIGVIGGVEEVVDLSHGALSILSVALKESNEGELLGQFAGDGVIPVVYSDQTVVATTFAAYGDLYYYAGITNSNNKQEYVDNDIKDVFSVIAEGYHRKLDITQNKEQVFLLRQFADLTDTLEEIHRQNHVHRDIKPSNILVTSKDGAYKLVLADFQQVLDVDSVVTNTNRSDGPDAIYSGSEVFSFPVPESDLYSLAITLACVFFGEEPTSNRHYEYLSRTKPYEIHYKLLDVLYKSIENDSKKRGSIKEFGQKLRDISDCLVSGEIKSLLVESRGDAWLHDIQWFWKNRTMSMDVEIAVDLLQDATEFYTFPLAGESYCHFVEDSWVTEAWSEGRFWCFSRLKDTKLTDGLRLLGWDKLLNCLVVVKTKVEQQEIDFLKKVKGIAGCAEIIAFDYTKGWHVTLFEGAGFTLSQIVRGESMTSRQRLVKYHRSTSRAKTSAGVGMPYSKPTIDNQLWWLDILIDLASTLATLESLDIGHGNIKFTNLILTESSSKLESTSRKSVVLCDFRNAYSLSEEQSEDDDIRDNDLYSLASMSAQIFLGEIEQTVLEVDANRNHGLHHDLLDLLLRSTKSKSHVLGAMAEFKQSLIELKENVLRQKSSLLVEDPRRGWWLAIEEQAERIKKQELPSVNQLSAQEQAKPHKLAIDLIKKSIESNWVYDVYPKPRSDYYNYPEVKTTWRSSRFWCFVRLKETSKYEGQHLLGWDRELEQLVVVKTQVGFEEIDRLIDVYDVDGCVKLLAYDREARWLVMPFVGEGLNVQSAFSLPVSRQTEFFEYLYSKGLIFDLDSKSGRIICLRIFIEVARILYRLKEIDLIHGEVNVTNILLNNNSDFDRVDDFQGMVMLCNFGNSRKLDLEDQDHLGDEQDLYSLALTLSHVLFGAELRHHDIGSYLSGPTSKGYLHPDLVDILVRATDREVTKRGHLEDFAGGLQHLVSALEAGDISNIFFKDPRMAWRRSVEIQKRQAEREGRSTASHNLAIDLLETSHNQQWIRAAYPKPGSSYCAWNEEANDLVCDIPWTRGRFWCFGRLKRDNFDEQRLLAWDREAEILVVVKTRVESHELDLLMAVRNISGCVKLLAYNPKESWAVTEFVSYGVTLEQYLFKVPTHLTDERKVLSSMFEATELDDASYLAFFSDVAKTLARLEENGILYTNLKFSSILISNFDQRSESSIVLCDFGRAYFLQDEIPPLYTTELPNFIRQNPSTRAHTAGLAVLMAKTVRGQKQIIGDHYTYVRDSGLSYRLWITSVRAMMETETIVLSEMQDALNNSRRLTANKNLLSVLSTFRSLKQIPYKYQITAILLLLFILMFSQVSPCIEYQCVDSRIQGKTEWSAGYWQRPILLRGPTFVEQDAELYIEAGTVIYTEANSSLVVLPGAKFVADGAIEKPISFVPVPNDTSQREHERGHWNGISILGCGEVSGPLSEDSRASNYSCGDGKANAAALEMCKLPNGKACDYGVLEGSELSSKHVTEGRMSYVFIAYPGNAKDPNNDSNGLTLGAVTSKFELDNVAVYESGDDCFEFFGGNVDARYLSCLNAEDDGLDLANGYSGAIQFFYLDNQRVPESNCSKGRNGIELDSTKNPWVVDVVLKGIFYTILY